MASIGHLRQKSNGSTLNSLPSGTPGVSRKLSAALSINPLGSHAEQKSSGAKNVSMGLFADSSFNAADYIQNILQGSTEEQIRQFYKNLGDARDTAAADIQLNVHRNYHEFILISKEISKLEEDMLTIRESLNDMRLVCETVFGDDGHQTNEPSTVDSPMLALNDEVVLDKGSHPTRDDLPLLKEKLDGLSKIIQDDLPRTLAKEGNGFVEVHQDSSRSGKSITFYLLNDTLVVASKKRRAYGKTKLVAEHAFSLQEMAVIDMKDAPPEIFNSIKIIRGSDSFVFRAETLELKRSWLNAIKRSTQDAPVKKRDTTSRGLAAEASRVSNQQSLEVPSETVELLKEMNEHGFTRSTLSQGRRHNTMLNQHDVTNPDLAWLKDMPDDLDVFIAHREFDQAVQCIERGKGVIQQYSKESIPLVHEMKRRLDDRVQLLSKTICRDLANPSFSQNQIRLNVVRLLKLGLGEQARSIFLSTRSAILRQKVKQLIFEGDTTQYINELSFIVFNLIKHSCSWYKASFKDPRMCSGFIRWVKQELEFYSSIFRCQVFHDGQRFDVIADCLASTTEHCRMLSDVGLNVSFIFDQHLFQQDVAQTIELYRTRVISGIAKSIADDEFNQVVQSLAYIPAESASGDPPLETIPEYRLTPSCKRFYEMLILFLTDLSPLVPVALYPETVQSISNFYEAYFRHLMDLSQDPQYSDQQQLFIINNLHFLANIVLPVIRSILIADPLQDNHFSRSTASVNLLFSKKEHPQIFRFGRPIPELDKMLRRFGAMVTVMLSDYYQRRATRLAIETYAFGPYSLASVKSTVQERRRSMSPTSAGNASTGFWMDYSSDAYPILDQSMPSDAMILCIKDLHKLALTVEDTLIALPCKEDVKRPFDKEAILTGSIECFFTDLADERNWVTKHEYERLFGYSGVQQFVLDIHLFLKICDGYLSPETLKIANDACSRALKIYFKRAKDPNWILKGGDWYDKRVAETIKKVGKELRHFGTYPPATSTTIQPSAVDKTVPSPSKIK